MVSELRPRRRRRVPSPARDNEQHRRGALELNTWHLKEGKAHLERALALNSNDARAHVAKVQYSSAMGRVEDAYLEARDALEIDPLSIGANLTYMGAALSRGWPDSAIA